MNKILADHTISISEFKNSPLSAVEDADGSPVVVLSNDQPVFYCIPVDVYVYEAIMGELEDAALASIARDRKDQKEIMMKLDEL